MDIKAFRGICNTKSPDRLRTGEFVSALDVDLDNSGKVLSRRGFTNRNLTALHSLYSNHRVALGVSGTNLVAVEPNWSYTTVKALSSAAKLSCETVGDVLYYSNGVDMGRIVNRTWSCWGVVPPVGQGVATRTAGHLPEGRYMYAWTFVRGADGHESGTPLSGYIDVSDNSGISISSIEVSTNAEVTHKTLYLSPRNAEVLYRAAVIPNAQTSYTYAANQLDLTIPLATQFAGPPPPGTLVRENGGVLCVVDGGTVWCSDPYGFELFRQDTNFLQFPGKVVMFETVNDGTYVGTADAGGDDSESTGSVWFLPGDRLDQAKSVQLFDYGVIEGSCVRSDQAYFETPIAGQEAGENSRPIVVFATRHGICVGRDGGNCRNMTETVYSLPAAQRAAAFVRLARGFSSCVISLQGVGVNTNKYTLPT